MLIRVHSAVMDRGIVIPVVLEFFATHHGLPSITFLGSPHASILESRARVLACFRSLGILLPRAKVTINMLPVDVKKYGSSLDLPIALGLLMLHGFLPASQNVGAIGELGLSSEVRFTDQTPLLAEQLSACEKVFVSSENISALQPIRRRDSLYPTHHLQEVMSDLSGGFRLSSLGEQPRNTWWEKEFFTPIPDGKIGASLAEVLKVSILGGHHLLVYGSPGIGKSYMKTYLPTLLPVLSREAMRERVLRRILPYDRIVAPHTSATIAGLLGGGSPFQPGAFERADKGILFLDELPEFSLNVLESLRQPLEEEGITLVRSGTSHFVPCSCIVIATANPCPCGYFGEKRCVCALWRVQQYVQRLSGPLIDRFALQHRMMAEEQSISLSQVAEEIARAREFISQTRPQYSGLVRLFKKEDLQAIGAWESGYGETLSLRRKLHVARVARTVADLRLSTEVISEDWDKARDLCFQSWA